jgi:hypothetical protein
LAIGYWQNNLQAFFIAADRSVFLPATKSQQPETLINKQ